MTTKSFIKTIGEKGLLADYNTAGKKLQTELTAGDNITIDGNTISSDQIFVATYGTTKYAEVKAAFDAGKLCMVFKDNRTYFIERVENDVIRFVSSNGVNRLSALTLNSPDSWSIDNSSLQSKLTFDSAPTAGSNNPVTSEGIKKAIDNKATQFSLGSTAGSRVYTMFARMSDSNPSYDAEGQVILSSAGNYGLTNQGTWEIIVTNRGSTASSPKAHMTVRCINAVKAMSGTVTEPTFGYYIDTTNHYIYFGIYSPQYRGKSNITVLVNNNVTFQDFGDSTTAPTGWTTVEPTGVSSAVKLDTARTIQTDLASTSSAGFDGTANITPGVTGTLPVANGGTGSNTEAGARTNLSVYSKSEIDSRIPAPTSTTGTQVLKCIDGVIQWVTE